MEKEAMDDVMNRVTLCTRRRKLDAAREMQGTGCLDVY